MRREAGNRIPFGKVRKIWILSVTVVIVIVMTWCGKISGCEVEDVDLFLGKTADEVENYPKTALVLCPDATSFWVRVEWDLDGQGANPFQIWLWHGATQIDTPTKKKADGGSETWWYQAGITEGEDPSPFQIGSHVIRARVKREHSDEQYAVWDTDDGDDPVTLDVVEVANVEADPTSVCLGAPITFTANANPDGKALDCIEWERCKWDPSLKKWTEWEAADGTDNTAVLNPATSGWYKYRARNGSGDSWKESVEVAVVEFGKVIHKWDGFWRHRWVSVPKGDSIQFRALPQPAYNPWWGETLWPATVSWKLDGESAGTGETKTFTFDELRVYYVEASGCGGGETIDVYVEEVRFVQDTGQTYGFDDWKEPLVPVKSIEDGQSDTAKAKIVRTPINSVYFKSVDTSKVTVTPDRASVSPQPIDLTAVATGESEIRANAGSVEGTNINVMVGLVYDRPAVAKKVLMRAVTLPGQWVWLPFSSDDLKNYLNDTVFSQCVISFEVTRVSGIEVAYDLVSPPNGKLDYGSTGPGSEQKKIIDEAEEGTYDYYIFIVKETTQYSAWAYKIDGKYIFMEEDVGLPKWTAAHEIGHCLGLEHVWDMDDEAHLMAAPTAYQTRLRKDDWTECRD